MPPRQQPADRYFINIICDFSLVTQYERLRLPTPQQLQQSNNNIDGMMMMNTGNGGDQQQQQQQQKSYLCALCEDVGMERAALMTVTKGSPYLATSNMMMTTTRTATTSSSQQQQQHHQPLDIICVVITLPQESVRILYRQGNLVKFLKDGLQAIQQKYSSCNNNKNTEIKKAFLVIEVPRNASSASQDTLVDHGIMSELLIFQTATEGSGVIAGCTFVTASPPPSTSSSTNNNVISLTQQQQSQSSSSVKDEVSSYIQALGNYLTRKAAMVTATTSENKNNDNDEQEQEQQKEKENSAKNNNIFANFNAKIRDRDDTFTLFEPQFLTRGKIDTADWAAAYRSFLCEIEGITPQKAVSIISKFPSLKSLLDAISRKDQRSMAILADSVGGNSNNNNTRRVGDALVQRIIDKMTTKFDEKIALHSNARSFVMMMQQQNQQQRQ